MGNYNNPRIYLVWQGGAKWISSYKQYREYDKFLSKYKNRNKALFAYTTTQVRAMDMFRKYKKGEWILEHVQFEWRDKPYRTQMFFALKDINL